MALVLRSSASPSSAQFWRSAREALLHVLEVLLQRLVCMQAPEASRWSYDIRQRGWLRLLGLGAQIRDSGRARHMNWLKPHPSLACQGNYKSVEEAVEHNASRAEGFYKAYSSKLMYCILSRPFVAQ